MPIHFFKHINSIDDEHVINVRVPDSLQEFVEGFYVFKKRSINGRQLLFNDGYPVVIISPRRNSQNQIDIQGKKQVLDAMWVCGGVLKNVYWELDVCLEDTLVVRFYPITFYKLFGIPENYFEKRQVVSFSEIAGSRFGIFLDSYYKFAVNEEKIKAVTAFITEKIGDCSYPRVLVDILDHIDKCKGQLIVRELLERYGNRLNYKWLERNFKKHLGISPQQYILLQRFLNAYLDLEASSSKDLLQIAIDNGYSDDNHFIKDFRQYSGMPPKTYFQSLGKNS